MADRVISQVRFEIEQIDRLFESYAALLAKARKGKLDLIEVTAIASVLHSFYNGLENISLSIAKGIDKSVPTGAQWHRDLLVQMGEDVVERPPVLEVDTIRKLADYLAFRHFYRHSYTFFLEWEELEGLVIKLAKVWAEVKGELDRFLERLSEVSR